MWFDDLSPNDSWTSLWYGYIRCPECTGIRTLEDPCPACGTDLPTMDEQTIVLDDGQEVSVARAYMGAETRYEDYVYLQVLEREWKYGMQPPSERMSFAERVPTGAAIVLIFWTYFESRIEYLLRSALQHIPQRFLDDALTRYSSVGARMDRLYRIAFGTTYHSDLTSLKYSDVSRHLSRVQAQRNAFVHGTPDSIDDSLVASVVEMLKREHEAWIAVYNLRASRPPSR